MKKRNKKYNPKKIGNLYQAQANQNHVLEMTFNIDDVNENIDQWREENNLADKELTPKHVVYEVYHGDLIICLKNLLIPLEQEWFLGVDSHYYNAETDEVLTVPTQFQMPKMSFEEFRFGSDLKVDRGHGLKTRWKGINDELNEILLSEVPVGFERVRSDALLRVETRFNNTEDYLYFRQAKLLRSQGMAA
ncbi:MULTISPECIES: hypothetical protein [unclassified Acinetobacter]|uniref:hypothetical protein n=1 Tax=unclassified Acinetobacter TaxID=196816 RepID=UPI0029348741|nr:MULTISPECIES: hypothetical protein [unclassified Acinetobacter]WOE32769.1 hypothetical protein QSG84_06235 [Acinetobacter sp. SAAs470]WOE38246.1 hypothetical protein QSG86_15290 [Acinetobacter sp. SAAs474]